jgi:addiction module HigA family antidote
MTDFFVGRPPDDVDHEVDLRSARPVHPGAILREEMHARGWTSETICKKTTLSRVCVSALLSEKMRIDRLIADELARAFGRSAEFWLKLQAHYDEAMKEETT